VTKLWVPPHPPRRPKPVPTWRGFLGERARTAVYGWSQLAFQNWYFKRNILGHTVHVVLHPDWVQRVLLDNAANYEKPKLVKRILGPTIGREGMAWRKDPHELRVYSQASWVWVGVFGARLCVQLPFYLAGSLLALGIAKTAMGLPVFALGVWLSYLILKRGGLITTWRVDRETTG